MRCEGKSKYRDRGGPSEFRQAFVRSGSSMVRCFGGGDRRALCRRPLLTRRGRRMTQKQPPMSHFPSASGVAASPEKAPVNPLTPAKGIGRKEEAAPPTSAASSQQSEEETSMLRHRGHDRLLESRKVDPHQFAAMTTVRSDHVAVISSPDHRLERCLPLGAPRRRLCRGVSRRLRRELTFYFGCVARVCVALPNPFSQIIGLAEAVDPKSIAGRFTRQRWSQTRGGFNRKLD